jgi:hypothetical protein
MLTNKSILTAAILAALSGAASAQCLSPAVLQASDRSAWDLLGLGGTAMHSNLIVSGAPFEDNARGTDVGALYIFKRAGGIWSQSQKLIPPAGVANDCRTGYAIATDGQTIATYSREQIALQENDHHGQIFVYENAGGVFNYKATLDRPGATAHDWFGWALGVSGDWIASGAFGADNASGQNSGELRLFKRTNGVWSNNTTWLLAAGNDGAGLGTSVAMNSQYAAAGAPGADVGAIADAGKVMILKFNGTTWTLDTVLSPPSPEVGGSFGESVSLAGNRLLVGAPETEAGSASGTGAAYVYRRDAAGWVLETTLIPSSYHSWFGMNVALTETMAVVSDSPSFAGTSRVFRRSGTQWYEASSYEIPDDGEAQGWMNSLAAYGSEFAMGNADQNDGAMRDSGGVHVVPVDPDAAIDDCSDAFPISAGVFTGCTANATTDGVSTCGTNTGKDVWYTYTASITGTVVMNTEGSLFDTVLSLHSGCGSTSIVCDDDSGAGNASSLKKKVVAGETMLVRIAGYNQASGAYTLSVGERCPADFNLDGQVDFFDYLDFAAAFDAEDAAADFNSDDQVDFFDYLDFAAAFDAGC